LQGGIIICAKAIFQIANEISWQLPIKIITKRTFAGAPFSNLATDCHFENEYMKGHPAEFAHGIAIQTKNPHQWQGLFN
jgi:hypothetical protein